MILETIATIIFAWIVSTLLAMVTAPITHRLFGKTLADGGWALNRIVWWMLVSLPIWFIAHMGIPANTTVGVWVTVAVWMSLGIVLEKRHNTLNAIRKLAPIILIEELLFFTGFLYLSFVRGFNPHILDLEKFMDAGFMASYLRSPTLPAPDMWLAGETINYYSFGHFLGSMLTRVWNLPVSYSYNLLLGFIMGLGMLLSFSVAYNLSQQYTKSKKISTYSGVLATLLVTIAGNSHTIIYLLKNGNFEGYWYADATRFIYHTIHEFPSYSFVVSDLHAHLWSFPLVLSFLLVTMSWCKAIYKKDLEYTRWSVVLGGGVGVFAMTSAWDAMIYPLYIFIISFLILLDQPKHIKKLLISALISIFSALIIAAPFLMHFSSISEGIALVKDRSPLLDFLTLWSGHLILSLLALVLLGITRIKNRVKIVPMAMLATAILLLTIPELIYVKDIYTDHPRANTMFKLSYQAFILMSLTGSLIPTLITKVRHKIIKAFVIMMLFVVTASLVLFPYFSYRDYYNRFQNHKGLYGYQWLRDESPDDHQVIMWIQQNIKNQPIILEAVGESYTKHNRVSAITGIPTILGWRVHEWLWRGGFDIPGERTTQVETIYTMPRSNIATSLLNEYNVDYIFVGDKERETYRIDVEGLLSITDVAFQKGNTYLLKYNH